MRTANGSGPNQAGNASFRQRDEFLLVAGHDVEAAMIEIAMSAGDFISSMNHGMDHTMSKKGQHVVPREDGWSVRRAGSSRASGNYATQDEAIDAATRIARNQGTEVYVHGRDGRIRERNTYSNDPLPPQG